MTEEIAKKITDPFGTYSGYDIFSDWIKSLSISISNSTDLVESEIWKQREVKRVNIYEAAKRALAEGKYIKDPEFRNLKIKVEARDVCTLMRMDGSRPVKGWEPTAEQLMAETWELTE